MPRLSAVGISGLQAGEDVKERKTRNENHQKDRKHCHIWPPESQSLLAPAVCLDRPSCFSSGHQPQALRVDKRLRCMGPRVYSVERRPIDHCGKRSRYETAGFGDSARPRHSSCSHRQCGRCLPACTWPRTQSKP